MTKGVDNCASAKATLSLWPENGVSKLCFYPSTVKAAAGSISHPVDEGSHHLYFLSFVTLPRRAVLAFGFERIRRDGPPTSWQCVPQRPLDTSLAKVFD